MKKYICAVLALVLLTAFFASCGRQAENTDSTTDTSIDTDASWVDNYGRIIDIYRQITEACLANDNYEYCMETLEYSLMLGDRTVPDWFCHIYDTTWNLRSLFSSAEPTFGYALRDLNGDSTDELLLMYDDNSLVAVFTMLDGRSLPLYCLGRRQNGYVDADGLIHIHSSGGAYFFSDSVYKLSDSGDELILLHEIGADGPDGSDPAMPIYYKLVDGKNKNITKGEYNTVRASEPFNAESAVMIFINFNGETKKHTEGLEFKLIDGGYEVVGIGSAGQEKAIYIPSEHEGMPVISISDKAFGGTANRSEFNAETVVIPNSVKKIGNEAFFYRSSLKSITIDGTVSLGDEVFSYCENLRDVKIHGIENMGTSVFSPDCHSLENVMIDHANVIGEYAFYLNDSLKVFAVPEGTERIEASAFQYCILEQITIPKSLTCFEGLAFCKTGSLTDIMYEGTIEDWKKIEIGNACFFAITSIKQKDRVVYCSDGMIKTNGEPYTKAT